MLPERMPPAFRFCPRRCRRNLEGFSLVSILAVLAIVATLAAMVMATAPRMLQVGNKTKCLANLRQIGLANINFANDNDGLIAAGSVYGSYWYWDQLPGYLDGTSNVNEYNPVFICPSDSTQGWGEPRVSAPIMRRSYGLNSFLQQPQSPYGPKKMLEIPFPARTAYAGDNQLSPAISSWISGEPDWLNALSSTRHDQSMNFVFLDGHVGRFEIKSLHYGKTNSEVFTGSN